MAVKVFFEIVAYSDPLGFVKRKRMSEEKAMLNASRKYINPNPDKYFIRIVEENKE